MIKTLAALALGALIFWLLLDQAQRGRACEAKGGIMLREGVCVRMEVIR